MPPDLNLLRRQIWATPTSTTSLPRHCSPFRLPSGGVLNIGKSTALTLTEAAIFQPACTGLPKTNSTPPQADSHVFNDNLPFYSSTSPQVYAVAAATVISYLLVIMLFITPRTLFAGGVGGGGGFLGHKGIISRASGSTPVIGAEERPWLQKAAALSVAVSLTYASVDTFTVAKEQYNNGYQDALALTDAVVMGLASKIIRLISTIFVWLAQAQTLIKLFPRHREKLIIEWTGLVTISLDAIFSALKCFLYENLKVRPRNFDDAIPALSYLFSSALGVVYATMVMFYSFQKGRFAYFHPKMRNICLLATLSLVAILIPIAFFILDIAKPNVAGWGHYVRWVGSAAASVVVWEWVERIEALEAEERKDGILGREIFDGDEMLEVTPSSEVSWPKSRRNNQGGHGGGGPPGGARSTGWDATNTMLSQLPRSRQPGQVNWNRGRDWVRHDILGQENQAADTNLSSNYPTQPSTRASPTSRGTPDNAPGTTQAGSHPTVSGADLTRQERSNTHSECYGQGQHQSEQEPDTRTPKTRNTGKNPKVRSFLSGVSLWPSLFGRERQTPPPEVSQGLSRMPESSAPTSSIQTHPKSDSSHISIFGRLRGKKLPNSGNALVPVIIIPAPPPSGRTSFIGTRSTLELEEHIDSPQNGIWDSTNRRTYRSPDAVINGPENVRRPASVPDPSSIQSSLLDRRSPVLSQQRSLTFSEDYRTATAHVSRTSIGVPQDGNAPPQELQHHGSPVSRFSISPASSVLASPDLLVSNAGRTFSVGQDEGRLR